VFQLNLPVTIPGQLPLFGIIVHISPKNIMIMYQGDTVQHLKHAAYSVIAEKPVQVRAEGPCTLSVNHRVYFSVSASECQNRTSDYFSLNPYPFNCTLTSSQLTECKITSVVDTENIIFLI
jgi:hypothetical protein